MTGRISTNSKTLIDPIFSIPIGAEEEFTLAPESTRFDQNPESESEDNSDTLLDLDSDLIELVDEDSGPSVILDTPQTFAVVSQTLRRAPGGQQVIDVVIQTESVEGAVDYEIRVTKL